METFALLDGFSDVDDIVAQFTGPDGAMDDATLVAASYTYEDYSGDAIVFWMTRDGKFFEQTGGHCSCDGLEGQWGPSEVTLDYIRQRAQSYGGTFMLEAVRQLWGMGAGAEEV